MRSSAGSPTPDLALGIDIGGTKVAAVLADRHGAIVARDRGPIAPESNAATLASVFQVADRILDCQPDARRRLVGIGAGAPGSIDWHTGVAHGATNLAWHDLPLAAALGDRYGTVTLLDNDVNVAAWGERCFGVGSRVGGQGSRPLTPNPLSAANSTEHTPIDHLAFIAVGTGIGSGLIETGRLVRGRRSAGEIGHIPLLAGGPPCKCGMSGCLEAAAAGPAFLAAGRGAAAAGRAPRLLQLAGGDPVAVTAPLIVQAAGEGDPGARQVLDREGYYLALAVLIAARMLDPAVVVIGGGLAEAGEPLFEALWTNLARLRPRGPEPRTYAVPSRLGPDAGAIGAAALILRPEPGFVAAGLIGPHR